MITAATRVAAVIGSPVRHSLSPALHNAAFRQLEVDWIYVALEVGEGRAPQALDAMRALGLAGLSVTTPHKRAVAEALDEIDPAARALQAVNTVVAQADGSLMGFNTDGAGFVASLTAKGVTVAGSSLCVIGAGAAARAICDQLGRAGAARVAVVNRTASGAEAAAALAVSGGDVVGVVGSVGDITNADIVVNATSIGMGTSEAPCDTDLLRKQQVVVDIVYQPRDTVLLRAARRIGATAIDGLGMLVHQAALQQRHWHGLSPDIDGMAAAAERELASRQH